MTYIVPSCTISNCKPIGIGVNRFYVLVRYKPFACKGFVVSGINLKTSSINQNFIINIKVSGCFIMKAALPRVIALST